MVWGDSLEVDESAGRPRRGTSVSVEESPDSTGQVVGNTHPGRPAGKCHRKETAAVRFGERGKGERVV